MDNEIFLKQLQELAVVELVSVPRTGGVREANEPEEILRNGQIYSIDLKNNPTLNLRVKALKTQPQQCSDCDRVVQDRKLHQTVYAWPFPHWRKNCSVCRKTQDPQTKEFSIPTTTASAYFASILKKKK
jgi:hypothetical protein